jgi:hypothetical protein
LTHVGRKRVSSLPSGRTELDGIMKYLECG